MLNKHNIPFSSEEIDSEFLLDVTVTVYFIGARLVVLLLMIDIIMVRILMTMAEALNCIYNKQRIIVLVSMSLTMMHTGGLF